MTKLTECPHCGCLDFTLSKEVFAEISSDGDLCIDEDDFVANITCNGCEHKFKEEDFNIFYYT